MPDYLTMIAALVLVLALLVATLWGLKRLGLGGVGATGPSPGQPRRLQIIESLPLSANTRAIILRMDQTDHLVILGPNGQSVVSQKTETKEQ